MDQIASAVNTHPMLRNDEWMLVRGIIFGKKVIFNDVKLRVSSSSFACLLQMSIEKKGKLLDTPDNYRDQRGRKNLLEVTNALNQYIKTKRE